MSSTRGRIHLPDGIPFQGRVVSPGHRMAMLRPSPESATRSCRFRSSPKESSSSNDSEPQAIAAMVRIARFFCTREERMKS